MKTNISLVVTLLNEEQTVAALLDSVVVQHRQPDEVIIVDGGSRDRTVEIVESYRDRLPLRLEVRPGANIAQGRNTAISLASSEIIACTDGGVRLSPEWLAELTAPFEDADAKPDVVFGFFLPDTRTVFETAMGATVLPAIDEIDPDMFIPSSRSIAFSKAAWQQVGGYPEWLDFCEDFLFDLWLREGGYRFVFAPRAIVHFRPRGSLSAFFKQYYRYSRGDGKANLNLQRHLARYGAYLSVPFLIAGALRIPLLWLPLLVGGGAYLYRPYRRLRPALRDLSWGERVMALLQVPLIRLTGDIAKMSGYPAGWRWRIENNPPQSPQPLSDPPD